MLLNRKYLARSSHGNYQIIMRIPTDLQSTLNSKWIRRSLKTKNDKDAELILNSWLGKIHTSFALIRAGVLNEEQLLALRASIVSSKTLPHEERGKTLQELIDLYMAECSPNWGFATRRVFAQKFQDMIEKLGGDREVATFSREEFLTYRNAYSAEGWQPKTVNSRLSLLSSLLKWGVRHGYLQTNHAEGMLLKLNKAPDEQRKMYEKEDIKLILEKLPRSIRCPWQFWVPLIGMYSGMRREEICQLRGRDIIVKDDIPSFRITADAQAGLKVKTVSSSRIIPIHPVLISQGFLRFTEGKAPEGNLWGFKKYSSTGTYGSKFGNWYSLFNKEHITSDPLKSFHSLRHTFTDTLKQAGVQEALIAELVGHQHDSITMNRYGKRYRPKVLFEALEKIDYGVSLG